MTKFSLGSNKIFYLLFPFLFHYLFYNQLIGLNLILTETVLIAVLFYLQRFKLNQFNIFLLGLWFFSSISILRHADGFSIFVNLFLFINLAVLPITKHQHYLENIVLSFLRFTPLPTENGIESSAQQYPQNSSKWGARLKLFAIPIIIILLFFVFYANSIPGFLKFFESLFEFFPKITFISILIFILGFIISIYYWRRKQDYQPDLDKWFSIQNLSKQKHGNIKGLSTELSLELKRHVFTISALIVMIIMALILDIKYLFFSNPGEQAYNEMQWAVRQGTFGLILSIIASIFFAIYAFRGNLSFFSKAAGLKKLTFIWLSLNLALACSLIYRTVLYIQFYNLAYKRIAVIAFIICAIAGLITVIYKIGKNKNSSFLVRINLNIVLLVCVIFSLPNWDRMLVKYNMSHPEAFVDYDFIYTRDINAVKSYLDNPEILEKNIGGYVNYSWLNKRYGSITYSKLIEIRTNQEYLKVRDTDWRSWNINRAELKSYLESLGLEMGRENPKRVY